MCSCVSFRYPHIWNPRLQDDCERQCQMYLESPSFLPSPNVWLWIWHAFLPSSLILNPSSSWLAIVATWYSSVPIISWWAGTMCKHSNNIILTCLFLGIFFFLLGFLVHQINFRTHYDSVITTGTETFLSSAYSIQMLQHSGHFSSSSCPGSFIVIRIKVWLDSEY